MFGIAIWRDCSQRFGEIAADAATSMDESVEPKLYFINTRTCADNKKCWTTNVAVLFEKCRFLIDYERDNVEQDCCKIFFQGDYKICAQHINLSLLCRMSINKKPRKVWRSTWSYQTTQSTNGCGRLHLISAIWSTRMRLRRGELTIQL